jgi:hypothetical protein
LVSGLEKWNSVRVSFCLPSSAAHRLRKLAEVTPQSLIDLGLHSVQVEGADTVGVTIRGPPAAATSSALNPSSSLYSLASSANIEFVSSATTSTFNFDTNANGGGSGGGHLSDSESRVESGLGSSRLVGCLGVRMLLVSCS